MTSCINNVNAEQYMHNNEEKCHINVSENYYVHLLLRVSDLQSLSKYVEKNCYLRQFWLKSSVTDTMVLGNIIINYVNQTYSHFNCSNCVHHIQMFTNPSLFPAVLFFLPSDPPEQCWATQINTYSVCELDFL